MGSTSDGSRVLLRREKERRLLCEAAVFLFSPWASGRPMSSLKDRVTLLQRSATIVVQATKPGCQGGRFLDDDEAAAFSTPGKGELGTKGRLGKTCLDTVSIDFRVPFVRYMNSWAEISKRRSVETPIEQEVFRGRTLWHTLARVIISTNSSPLFCRIHVL